MAITTSAKKAIRVSARRRVFNTRRKRAMKATMKETLTLLQSGKTTDAAALLPAAFKAIDKAMKRGVIKKNTAARKKSRLAKAFGKKSA